MKSVIELSTTVHASAGELWHALTDSDELENWWGEGIKIEPKVGGQFKEKWEDDEENRQLASGKILEVQFKKLLRFTWSEKSWPKNSVTECIFEISEIDANKSQLTVKHIGWETLPENIRAQTLKEFKIGWGFHLKELKEYLDF